MLKYCITLFIVSLHIFFSMFTFAEDAKNDEKIIFGGSKIGVKVNIQQGSDATFNLAFDQLMAHRDIDVNVHLFETSQALFEAFNRGEVNAVFASPIEFIQLEEQMGETMIAVNYQNAPIKQSFVVLVRKSDGITDINQLKNKRLSQAPLQDIAPLFLNTLLLENKQPELPIFFEEIFESKNANTAIMDVFFWKVGCRHCA